MGSLTPGVALVYEYDRGTVYAREIGADPMTRKEIGYEYDSRTSDGKPLVDHIRDDKLWGEIRCAAKTNPSLQEALDRAKIVYYLGKDNAK